MDNLKQVVAVTAVHSRKRPSSEDNSSSASQHTTPKRPKSATSFMKVSIVHPSGVKSFQDFSPWSQQNINRICRGSYPSLATSIVQSTRTIDSVLITFVQGVRQEIKHISSDTHNSILRDDHEGIKRFSWETVWTELMAQVPTLMKLLGLIIRNPVDNKPFLCLVASMILKHHSHKMSLVQRAISVLLYGCATPKKNTLRLISGLTDDFDIDILTWSDSFTDGLKERTHLTTNNCSEIYEMLDECDDTEDTDVYNDVDTEEEDEEIQAPEVDSVEYECVSSTEDTLRNLQSNLLLCSVFFGT